MSSLAECVILLSYLADNAMKQLGVRFLRAICPLVECVLLQNVFTCSTSFLRAICPLLECVVLHNVFLRMCSLVACAHLLASRRSCVPGCMSFSPLVDLQGQQIIGVDAGTNSQEYPLYHFT